MIRQVMRCDLKTAVRRIAIDGVVKYNLFHMDGRNYRVGAENEVWLDE